MDILIQLRFVPLTVGNSQNPGILNTLIGAL